MFIAKGLKKINEPKLDEDEFISVEKINLKKVIKMTETNLKMLIIIKLKNYYTSQVNLICSNQELQ
mgnify:CR=1 FL=1